MPKVNKSLLNAAARVPALAPHGARLFFTPNEMVASYLNEVGLHGNHPVASALRVLADTIDTSEYRQIQEKHLSFKMLKVLSELPAGSFEHKYIDFPFWMAGKLGAARAIGMSDGAYRRVLDLGSGPGHFGLVARYFGCEFVGLDCPLAARPTVTTHLYDDLHKAFKLQKVVRRIEAGASLEVPGRFDLVTCLMGNFSGWRSLRDMTPWRWDDWIFLLEDLIQNVVTPDRFTIYFHYSREFLTEIAPKLEPHCAKFDLASCTFTIDQSIDMGRLRKSRDSDESVI